MNIELNNNEFNYLLNKAKTVNDDKYVNENIYFIDSRTKFNFWHEGGYQWLDFVMKINNKPASYVLSINKYDIINLYNLIYVQLKSINNNNQ